MLRVYMEKTTWWPLTRKAQFERELISKDEVVSKELLILVLNVTFNTSGITCTHAEPFVLYLFPQMCPAIAIFCHELLDNVRELCCKYSCE